MPRTHRYSPEEAAQDIATMPPPPLPNGGALNTRDRPRAETNSRAFGVQATMLRLAGLTYAQIGEQLGGVSDDTARLAVKRHLDRAEVWSAAELRKVENARLDRAQAAIWTKVLNGDLAAVHAFLRLSERRSRLNGLDAPTSITLNRDVREEMERAFAELETVIGQVIAASDEATSASGPADD